MLSKNEQVQQGAGRQVSDKQAEEGRGAAEEKRDTADLGSEEVMDGLG